MILALDVHYDDHGSTTAALAFDDWGASAATASYISRRAGVADYVPGKFYERELPCILHLLREHALAPQSIIVDGYVFLDGSTRPGLGKFLFDALDALVPVIGVAKTAFAGIGAEYAVLRGDSIKPLYVTCAGGSVDEAKARVLGMHGKHRIPTLLKTVDQLCRSGAAPNPA